jgi:hypothetical protein
MGGGLIGSPQVTTVESYLPADYKTERRVNGRQWITDTKKR